MKPIHYVFRGSLIIILGVGVWLAALPKTLPIAARPAAESSQSSATRRPNAQTTLCAGEFIPISPALIDLGNNEYIRLAGGPDGAMGGPTGFTGGL